MYILAYFMLPPDSPLLDPPEKQFNELSLSTTVIVV